MESDIIYGLRISTDQYSCNEVFKTAVAKNTGLTIAHILARCLIYIRTQMFALISHKDHDKFTIIIFCNSTDEINVERKNYINNVYKKDVPIFSSEDTVLADLLTTCKQDTIIGISTVTTQDVQFYRVYVGTWIFPNTSEPAERLFVINNTIAKPITDKTCIILSLKNNGCTIIDMCDSIDDFNDICTQYIKKYMLALI